MQELTDRDLEPVDEKLPVKKRKIRKDRIVPTEAERIEVKRLAGLLLTSEQIGPLFRGGMSGRWVRLNFHTELEWGSALIQEELHKIAIERAKVDGVFLMFLLKCKCGWCDHQQPEPTQGMIDVLKAISSRLPE